MQRADLIIDERALGEIWTPMHLERLARTYWRFLTRVTLGFIQVRYSELGRYVVLMFRPLKLLTFQAPEYEISPSRGMVRWRIERGLIVAKRGRHGGGYLQIEVRRSASSDPACANLHVEVAVTNFFPSIASGLGRRLYNITQSRIWPSRRWDASTRRSGAWLALVSGQRDRRESLTARSLTRSCVALMRRMVPVRARVTSDSVVAPPALG